MYKQYQLRLTKLLGVLGHLVRSILQNRAQHKHNTAWNDLYSQHSKGRQQQAATVQRRGNESSHMQEMHRAEHSTSQRSVGTAAISSSLGRSATSQNQKCACYLLLLMATPPPPPTHTHAASPPSFLHCGPGRQPLFNSEMKQHWTSGDV
mgnify:CR=1 FL=1